MQSLLNKISNFCLKNYDVSNETREKHLNVLSVNH